MMSNFVSCCFILPGLGWHDCRSPKATRRSIHATTFKQLEFCFCACRAFWLGHIYYDSRCKMGTDMVARSWLAFNSNSGYCSIKTMDIFLTPSFWISWFTLLLPDQSLSRPWGLAPNSPNTVNRSAKVAAAFGKMWVTSTLHMVPAVPPGFQRSFFGRYDSTCLSSIGTCYWYVYRNLYMVLQFWSTCGPPSSSV